MSAVTFSVNVPELSWPSVPSSGFCSIYCVTSLLLLSTDVQKWLNFSSNSLINIAATAHMFYSDPVRAHIWEEKMFYLPPTDKMEKWYKWSEHFPPCTTPLKDCLWDPFVLFLSVWSSAIEYGAELRWRICISKASFLCLWHHCLSHSPLKIWWHSLQTSLGEVSAILSYSPPVTPSYPHSSFLALFLPELICKREVNMALSFVPLFLY